MADKTLYDILEVSETASHDTIRDAYVRLMKRYEPVDSASDTNVLQTAVKEAFFTLGNAQKRAAYDRRLEAQAQAVVSQPMGGGSKLLVAGLLALATIGGFMHYKSKQEAARIEQERVVAAEKAREAESLAAAEAARAHQKRLQFGNAIVEDLSTRRRDQEIARFQYEVRQRENENRYAMERERREKENRENQRRADEMRAQQVAQMRAARDRAELCQLERSRYGRSISC